MDDSTATRLRPLAQPGREKQMRIKILAPLMILLCAVNVLAQNAQCSLKLSELAEAPELIGFRMGMTTEQVRARVPQVAFGRTDEFGLSKTSINPERVADATALRLHRPSNSVTQGSRSGNPGL